MRFIPATIAMLVLLTGALDGAEDIAASKGRVHQLKITILSTMLADGPALGEWGFAALVEADGHRLLFDTGAHSDVVLRNAQALEVDLGTVPEVILSHSHSDHFGGLLALRQAVKQTAPDALALVHGGEGIFAPRSDNPMPIDSNPMTLLKPEFEKAGGRFVVHAAPVQLYPGIWLSGPIPRRHPERNWSGNGRIQTGEGWVEDNLPEDLALVIDTDNGLVVVTGCGHAGVINTIDHAREFVRPARIHALIGGLHLFNADEPTLRWTAAELNRVGVDHLIGAHCTGVEVVYQLRAATGLDRAHAVVGAVGAGFELGRGIEPGQIAK